MPMMMSQILKSVMTSQISKSVDFTKAQKSRYLKNEIFFLQIKKMGMAKPCTHLHPAHFWASLSKKIQSCLFCLKTGMYGISRTLILIPKLIF